VVKDREPKTLPQELLPLRPPRTPHPMVISKNNARIPRGPLPGNRMVDLKHPVNRPSHLVAIHEGVREGLLALAARGLTQPFARWEVEVVRHPRPYREGGMEYPPSHADGGRKRAAVMKTLPHRRCCPFQLSPSLLQVVEGVVIVPSPRS
jgi:hypothetical protein